MRLFLLSILFILGIHTPVYSQTVITGEEQYPLLSFFFRENSDFRRQHNLFPDGYISSVANDALKPGTKRDGYLTNMFEVQSYNHINHLMKFNGVTQFFSLSPIKCTVDRHFRYHGNDCLNPDINAVQITVRETYGHRLYTPKTELYKGLEYRGANEKIVNPAEFDRPFAAWAYYNKTLEINHGWFQQRHTTSFGLVGEAAMGRAVQEWAHKYPFSGPEKIQGWETQVGHRIALQYQAKFSANSPSVYDPTNILGLKLIANSYFDYGNIIQSLGLGIEANISVGGTRHCLPNNWKFASNSFIDSVIAKENHHQTPPSKVTCSNIEPWLLFDVEFRRDRVYYNYLIEDGIHVPDNVITQEELNIYNSLNTTSDLPPINPILVSGGEINVSLQPYVNTFTAGVTAFDVFRVGYMKRTEETREQDERHEWLEIQVNIKGDSGWLFLPLLLAYRSWQS